MQNRATAGGPAARAGSEIEIKFRSDREGLERTLADLLPAAPEPPRSQSLRTVYYDTRSLRLRQAGWVLRLRKAGRAVPLLGFKSRHAEAGHPFRRKEFETRSPRGAASPDLFDAATAALLRKAAGDEEIEARFEIRTRRRTLLARQDESAIELAFDDGLILAGARRQPLFEVELELKSGLETGLLAFARSLADGLPLALDFVSKGEKGFRLATGEAAMAARATPIHIDSEAALDVAIAAIVSNTLLHFTANWASLRERDDPEAVHQLRVSMRRLRSALRMFGPVLPQPQGEALRGEARAIATGLAPARDVDVFGASVEQGPLAEQPDLRTGVLAALEDRRRAAYVEARSLINGREATCFVLAVQAFLAEPGWRGPSASIAARTFARKALTKLHHRVLKRGEGFPSIPDKERHKLRIALKNLRYAVEFLGGLFGHKRAQKTYTGAVSSLQDLLGAHNDEVTARRLLADPALSAAASADFLMGWYARGSPDGDSKLCKAWKTFRRAETFWEQHR